MSVERSRCIGTCAYMGGIPALPAPFVWSWTQMMQFNGEALCGPGEHIKYVRSQFSLHSAARREIAGQVKGDWLFTVDCDMVFDPDICGRLVRLMQRYDADVVTALYPYKTMPQVPVAYMFNSDTGRHEPLGDWPDCDLVEISSAGLGACLISKRILERVVVELHADPFEMIGAMGEDHSFFARVRKLGAKVYCAPRVTAGHISQTPVLLSRGNSLPRATQYQGLQCFGMRENVPEWKGAGEPVQP